MRPPFTDLGARDLALAPRHFCGTPYRRRAWVLRDEPASGLLKRIEVRKAGDLSSAQDIDALPKPVGWAWTTLGTVATLVMGHSPPGDTYNRSGQGVPLINGPVEFTPGPFGKTIINQYTTAPTNFCEEGDLLICVRGSTTGRTNVAGFRACIGRGVAAIQTRFDDGFIRLVILNARDSIIAMGRGIAFPSISRKQLEDLAFPLPPQSEQHRIVAKVDELMALCDRLEAVRAARELTGDRLTAVSLARLNTPDPETFRDDARFALDALLALTARPDQIRQLRQTILNLAVRGKLVRQDPLEGTGADLLAQIDRARKQEHDAGHRHKSASAQQVAENERYLEVPNSWAWARIFWIGKTQTGTTPSSANEDFFGDFVPFVKPADLDGDQVNYDGPGLSEQGMSRSRIATPNTVLMVCIGATLGKVNITDRTICFNQQINSVTSYLEGLHKFIAIALRASGFQGLAWSKAGVGTLPIISKGKWEVLPVPLPPLAEQQRIAAKVQELMEVCHRLEASLAGSAETRRRLLEALLAEALASDDERALEAAE
jgi:type I restriction enzyme S subunit